MFNRFYPTRILLLLATALTSSVVPAVAAQAGATFHLMVAPQTVHSDEVTLLWDKVDPDNSGITYQIFRDGKHIATTAKTHFTADKLKPKHAYVFTVKAGAESATILGESNPIDVHTAAKPTIVSVLAYGAKGDGTTLNTKAIQAAIDACPVNGEVYIPKGVFLSGALFLKSDMTLYIAAGGVLKGSTAPADYELFYLNRFEGWELKTYASLLNAGKLDHSGPANLHHLSIRGKGTVEGGGAKLGNAMIAAYGLRSRGRLICLMNGSDIEIQGLTLENPPCWTLHYIYCENVTCHDLTINSSVRNGDGMDPDSSRNCYIVNCSFSTGDDCIAIKSGKNPQGNEINRPSENIRITDCHFTRGHGISIGSEMSGGVRHVLVQDCVAGNLLNGLQIKATKDRGNVVEDVVVRDCDLEKIAVLTKLNYNNDGKPAPEQPTFRNFRFINLDLSKAKPSSPVIIVNGFDQPGHLTANVTFKNLKLPTGAIVEVDEARNVRFINVTTPDGAKPTYKVTRSKDISF